MVVFGTGILKRRLEAFWEGIEDVWDRQFQGNRFMWVGFGA